MAVNDAIKEPNIEESFEDWQIEEIQKCRNDVHYFIETYVKIKHPSRGAVPFVMFPYQKEMITVFAENRWSVILAGRQMGKCLSARTQVNLNGEKVEIGSLVPLTFREQVVEFLERLLLKLAK